jgi:hypothetical protein
MRLDIGKAAPEVPKKTPMPFWLRVFILLWCLVTFSILAADLSHCSTVSKKNSLGAVVEYVNPNAYLYGNIVDGSILGDTDLYTNVRFQPFHTFLLYTETVLFCGDRSKQFDGMTGPIVVTYKKQAHTLYQGVACHEFVSVEHVVAKEVR